MSPVLGIIVTLVLVGLLLWGVMKRMNAGFLLLVLGLGSIMLMQVITGTSVMGDASTGNLFFDLFEFFANVISKEQSLQGSAEQVGEQLENSIGESQSFIDKILSFFGF